MASSTCNLKPGDRVRYVRPYARWVGSEFVVVAKCSGSTWLVKFLVVSPTLVREEAFKPGDVIQLSADRFERCDGLLDV